MYFVFNFANLTFSTINKMDDSAGTSIEPEEARFKVVLLGEGAVGKSSMMLRYVENKFNPRHLSTIQASFATKKMNIDGRDVELNIWDTAGQEKFHALGPIYYRDSQGALLIYDITGYYKFVWPLKMAKIATRSKGPLWRRV